MRKNEGLPLTFSFEQGEVRGGSGDVIPALPRAQSASVKLIGRNVGPLSELAAGEKEGIWGGRGRSERADHDGKHEFPLSLRSGTINLS